MLDQQKFGLEHVGKKTFGRPAFTPKWQTKQNDSYEIK